MTNRIVVHYADGRILKGNGYDFSTEKPNFHLMPLNEQGLDKVIDVKVKTLKAIFFVKTFEGKPEYKESYEFVPGKTPYGAKVKVTFRDGEVIMGTSPGYDLDRQGFFLFPADPESNNIRIYVVSVSVAAIEALN